MFVCLVTTPRQLVLNWVIFSGFDGGHPGDLIMKKFCEDWFVC